MRLSSLFYLQGKDNRTGNIHGGVCTDQNADDHRKSKVIDNAASQNIERDDHGQGGYRREDCTSKGFINASVDDKVEGVFMIFAQVYPNSIKHDNRIV